MERFSYASLYESGPAKLALRSNCRVRRPGEFNDTISDPLYICSESFMTSVQVYDVVN